MVTDIATNVPSVQKIDYTSPHLFTRWGLFYAYHLIPRNLDHRRMTSRRLLLRNLPDPLHETASLNCTEHALSKYRLSSFLVPYIRADRVPIPRCS